MLKPAFVRQIFVLFVIAVVGFLIIFEMLPYLSGVLGAITLYVMLNPLMDKLLKKGIKKTIAIIGLMLASFIVIMIPLGGTAIMLGNKIGKAVKNSEAVINAFKTQFSVLEDKIGFKIGPKIDTGKVVDVASENLQNIAGGTFNVAISIAIMYLLLYYMLLNSKNIIDTSYKSLPFTRDSLKLIATECRSMVRANAIGIPVVGISQGIVALIGYLIFGVEDPFFWFVITAIGSMIPVIGTLIGIIPVFLLTLSAGDTFAAWGVLIYGLVIVGSTDNVVRLYALKRLDDVHPLITLIGVIIGVPLFGFIGLIFGPILLNLFLILLKVYNKEYIVDYEE
ncbi:MAG TPA: AI-2E family transporter [Flavobacteriaceae bacterium]|nr:AI-2E family transporter [Flavobacteriaceae bacterium]